jgi:hypothetical protein
MLPWRENKKLIASLYEEFRSLRIDVNRLRLEHDKLALVTEFKNEIASRVASDLKLTLTKEMSEEIATIIQKRLTGLKAGVI